MENHKTTKNIIFDLGAVLIDWNPRHLYRKIFKNPQEMEDFLTEICPMDWNVEMDGGKPFEQGCQERIKLFPQYAAQINAYYTRWAEMLGQEISGTVQILRELKQKGFPVYALTNWSAQTFPLAQAKFPFLQIFDGIVVSGQEKCTKPQARLYQILLERYHLQPKDCIFIDDNPANVTAAQALGMDALLFTTPQDLRAQLHSRQIL